jgi:hypothetical protein
MERLNIDSMGPFDTDELGNSYIIVIIDCFTRSVELYPTKDTTAIVAANVLLQHFGRYGCAYQLLSDCGSQYVNEIVEELIKLIGTENIQILAYSKEENSIVERSNKEILRHIRALIFDQNIIHKWSISLPFVQRIRGIITPLNNNNNNNDNNAIVSLSQWSSKMILIQQHVIQAAQKVQKEKDEEHQINAKPSITEFENNSFV